jgi:hypothetical protein
METRKPYQVFYDNNYVCTITAFSPYEAIDKVFYIYVSEFPEIDRNKLTTKKKL